MAPQQIAILGAGIFVRHEYLPRLSEISDLFVLKAIWSRSEESARGATDIAKKSFQEVECKWGDEGLNEIIQDNSIVAVLVVLAPQFQVDLSLKMLKAGKHVLQEKPAACSIDEAESALSSYNSLTTSSPCKPIWAVAENYRFEPAFMECTKLAADIKELINFQILVEVPMNRPNMYTSSKWRHDFTGGYVLDMGVHIVAALRMIAGCEVLSVSAATSHVDTTLPPPDTMSSVIQLENGCSGVFVLVASAQTIKMLYRFVGLNGTLQIEVTQEEGKYGNLVKLFLPDGQTKSSFYPFNGVTEELKFFLNNISEASDKKDGSLEMDPRISLLEGARDVAVVDAILESGKNSGALVNVKRF
ncbi:uncharacterized protein LOC127259279 isoform X1 [Andrographis paniculata]|uniref:uncharacterized protein LOC127259279 isoform X1 n=1 Tax=Andrographis paniculata TaxID=175694 RepID=UPI0021E99881|nr:uncharacterized protein LOC127259279 isoform X1 [Andrographis paniculata]XP_051142448.1 uncharacterized protein LOC127259279 isoform X1 [Andrographis paniculata]